MIKVTGTLSISEDDLDFTAIKASGPGGQHVNATSSAVQLRFDAAGCAAISDSLLARLRPVAGSRMTAAGIIVLKEDGSRSQHRNREVITERLVSMLKQASAPVKKRRKTKPTKGSVKRRLDGKAKRSQTKKARGKINRDQY